MKKILGTIIGLMYLLAPVHASAELRAMIVAVSEYTSLDKQWHLEGPKHDAQRLQQVLIQRGFKPQQIKVLADGVDGAARPTREAILRGLDELAASARPEDIILLYFAGHGSQQPADRRTREGQQEPDGLHEIFLPADVGQWDGDVGRVENAIVDYEFRQRVDRILDKGAFVWGVFDACHSASMVRGGKSSELRYRHLDPSVLGIKREEIHSASKEAVINRGGSSSQGALGELEVEDDAPGQSVKRGQAAYFYAAQTTEVTPEMRLPFGDPDRQTYGLFSFIISQALEKGRSMTYRQLMQYVLAKYGGISEARVTPMATGNGLDRVVFGQTTSIIRQWRLKMSQSGELSVEVGGLSEISAEAVFAILATPDAKDEEVIGYLSPTQVTPFASVLQPIEYEGKGKIGADQIPPRAFVRLVTEPIRYSLRVKIDSSQCGTPCPWSALASEAKSMTFNSIEVEWVDDSAELVMSLRPKAVHLLALSEQAGNLCESEVECDQTIKNQGIVLLGDAKEDAKAGPKTMERISTVLRSIARSNNILRMYDQLRGASGEAQKLEITLSVRRKSEGQAAVFRPVTADQVPSIEVGDKIKITLKNKGSYPVDVTILYLDARYGIGALFPDGEGEDNRLIGGAEKEISFEATDNEGSLNGRERIIVLASLAKKHGPKSDFSVLAQDALRDEQIKTRGAQTRGDLDRLLDAVYPKTRGAKRDKPKQVTTMMDVFHLDLQPLR